MSRIHHVFHDFIGQRTPTLALGIAVCLLAGASVVAPVVAVRADVPAVEEEGETRDHDLLLFSAEESPATPVAGVAELLVEDGSDVVPPMVESGPGRPTTRWLAGADFLLLRPSFSNSTAMLANTRTGGLVGLTPLSSSLDAINYDFGYSGGVRGFLGYQAAQGHVFRFTYTNYSAQTTAVGAAGGNWAGGNGTIVIGPYNTGADAPGETITSTAKVGLNIYDLEWARRLDVATDCGAPTWDVAAGAGLRFLSSGVSSNVFNNVVTAGFPDLLVTTNRTFGGVGPRLAGQVRRYFGAGGRWSGFGSVGGSLLVGSVSNTDTRLTLDMDQTFERQVMGGNTVIPNVDVSLGGTWQVRPRTSLSVGWTLMYFGNLGYSETISTQATPPGTPVTNVPLTNSSLSLDGVFFRFSHAF